MNIERLENYAKLIVKSGLNVQEGQEVLIQCGLDQPDFVTLVTEECYKAGAKRVTVKWAHQPVSKLHYLYRSPETLAEFTEIEKAEWQDRVNKLTCLLWLDSDDPDGLAGTDSAKIAAANMARFPSIKPFRDAMENRYQWCIAAVPGKKWANKIFPGMNTEQAMEKLWEAILDCSRVSGGETTLGKNIYFNPNIPSEEVFTSPMRGRAEGKIVSTKPLSYQGKLIENFWIQFKDGKAVKVGAEKNQDVLEKMVAMDEGAAYLGEVALIAYDSPINNTGVLFYNTLFDENASCHLALGRGFNNCLEGYENYTNEECEKQGINSSMIHVDFMIGSKDLSIMGVTKDGKRVQVFKDGNWAF